MPDTHHEHTVWTHSTMGTVLLLNKTEDLVGDVVRALDALRPGIPMPSRAEIEVKLAGDRESRGLRAEAGLGSSPAIINLYLEACHLVNGEHLMRQVLLSATPGGDAVYWLITDRSSEGFMTAYTGFMQKVWEMLVYVGGGRKDDPATPV